MVTHVDNVDSWRDVERRRLFFEKYAKKHAFDPLIPENWYKEPRKKIVSFKVSLLTLLSLSFIPLNLSLFLSFFSGSCTGGHVSQQ